MTGVPQPDRSGQGLLLMAAAALLLPVPDITSKYLAQSYDPVQIVWLRNVTHTLLLLPFLVPRLRRNPPVIRRPGLHLLRAICFVSMSLCYVSALRVMPLVDAQAIVFVFPLLVVALSAVFLGEVVTPRALLAVVLGFCGVLLVIRPGIVGMSPAALLVLGAALATAGYMVLNRKLSDGRSEAFLILAPPAFAAVVLGLAQPVVLIVPAPGDWPLFLLVGGANALCHAMILLAHARAPASRLAPLSYLQVLTGALLGYLVFSDIPALVTVAGLALVVAGGLLVRERHARNIGAGGRMR